MNKITMSLLAGVLLLWSTPVSAENDNLVHNPGFEQYAVQAGNFLSEGEYAELTNGRDKASARVFQRTMYLRALPRCVSIHRLPPMPIRR